MLALHGKHSVIISRIPVMQNGLGGVMTRHFPDFELTYCSSLQELTLLQLRRADVIIADISGEYWNPRGALEEYFSLLNQYRNIHWIFLVSRPLNPIAVELLVRPESTLLSDIEPIEGLVNAIRAGSERAERVSQALLTPEPQSTGEEDEQVIALTHSERKVLRLLGKGWGLTKSPHCLRRAIKLSVRRKTVRCDGCHYAVMPICTPWINSTQGMRELSLMSAYGEFEEWKKPIQQDISPSSKIAR